MFCMGIDRGCFVTVECKLCFLFVLTKSALIGVRVSYVLYVY